MNPFLPGFRLPIQRIFPAGQTAQQDAQKFVLTTLRVPDQDLFDPNGVLMNPGVPGVPRGGAITQWMDTDLAAACFAEARRQMDFAVNYASSKDPSGDLNGEQALGSAVYWIINGYNALNIPWYMDPSARSLFRQYLAGPPLTYAGITTTSEFGSLSSYNDKWFVPGSRYPGYSLGIISQQMYSLMKSVPELNDPEYTKQCINLWPYTWIPPLLRGNGPQDPVYGNNIANAFAGLNGFQDETDFSWVNAPGGDQSRDWQHPAGPNIDNNNPYNGITNNSWRTFSWQNNAFFSQFGAPKVISTPVIFYVPWIDAWATSVVSRDPQSIVIAARTYTTYTNYSKATASGSAQNFINQVLAVPGLENQQATTGPTQDSLRVAAGTVAALGVAFSGVTYGISGIVGGIIAGGLSIASATVRNTPHIARDDLGRFKPVIERGWLAGNPTVNGDLGRPPISVPAPIGWTRPLSQMVTAYGPNSLKPMPTQPSAVSQQNILSIPPDVLTNPVSWGWMAAAAAGVVAVYAGYRYFTTPAAKANPRKYSVGSRSYSRRRNRR